MRREDKFVGLVLDTSGIQPIDFGNGPVAEFKLAFEYTEFVERFGGRRHYVIHTHFRANLKSVRQRAANLSLPKNYGKVPWSLVEERAAEQAILAAM